jgi:hypothetical protein
VFLLCSSDFGRSLEESRDDLQSLGYDTPVPLIRSDSYTTLLDATAVLAALSGATLSELMGRLGHSTPVAAMRYQHVAQGRDTVIAEALSRIARGETS